MATIADVVSGVRKKLRDFPELFHTEITGDGSSQIFELPVVTVDAESLWVEITNYGLATPTTTTVSPTAYTLDAHHGMLMLNQHTLDVQERMKVVGRHYQWLLDSDIESEAGWLIESFESSVGDEYLFDHMALNDPKFELTLRGTLVGCLWNLLAEASLDIDVRNPEGVDIPVSQRFAQLQNLVQMWNERYRDLAEKLNIGITRIEIGALRRISYSTGRLVPLYRAQEFDDRATPQRVRPPVDDGLVDGT